MFDSVVSLVLSSLSGSVEAALLDSLLVDVSPFVLPSVSCSVDPLVSSPASFTAGLVDVVVGSSSYSPRKFGKSLNS